MVVWKPSDGSATTSAILIVLSFATWLCHEPKSNHRYRQKLCNKLLLQVLMMNFIGKCIRWLILLQFLHEDQKHTGNCKFIGYVTLFSDNGGLYFYTLAELISFSQTIPFLEKHTKFIDNINNPTYLKNRKHIFIWIIALFMSLIPFCFSAFGWDQHRCYVTKQLVLFACYRVFVYLFGIIFVFCSIYVWVKTGCLKSIPKQKRFKTFIPIVLFPFFIIAFSLPFEIQDICRLFGYNNHQWDIVSVTWGHLFGAAVAIIYLCSCWQYKLIKILNLNINISDTATTATEQQEQEEFNNITNSEELYSHISSNQQDQQMSIVTSDAEGQSSKDNKINISTNNLKESKTSQYVEDVSVPVAYSHNLDVDIVNEIEMVPFNDKNIKIESVQIFICGYIRETIFQHKHQMTNELIQIFVRFVGDLDSK